MMGVIGDVLTYSARWWFVVEKISTKFSVSAQILGKPTAASYNNPPKP